MDALALIARDKYDGDASKITEEDKERLAIGEPLAYIIGWVPFLSLRIFLDSRPLIPRPETEWWTELLIEKIKKHRPMNERIRVLDLCAGSGAIGLSMVKHSPSTHVTLSESVPSHKKTIEKNIVENNIDPSKTSIVIGDLFSSVENQTFDLIATNPPYIPDTRLLQTEVYAYEPHEALFSGKKGLSHIERIIKDASKFLIKKGELWLECDESHADEVLTMARANGAQAEIHNDQYGRPRLLVAQYL